MEVVAVVIGVVLVAIFVLAFMSELQKRRFQLAELEVRAKNSTSLCQVFEAETKTVEAKTAQKQAELDWMKYAVENEARIKHLYNGTRPHQA